MNERRGGRRLKQGAGLGASLRGGTRRPTEVKGPARDPQLHREEGGRSVRVKCLGSPERLKAGGCWHTCQPPPQRGTSGSHHPGQPFAQQGQTSLFQGHRHTNIFGKTLQNRTQRHLRCEDGHRCKALVQGCLSVWLFRTPLLGDT